jgi:hypothetical protein
MLNIIALSEKRKRHLLVFLSRPTRKVGKRTGISLSSVLRQKSKKKHNNGAFTSNRMKNQRGASIPPRVDIGILGILPASETNDSATGTPTSFETLDLDLFPSSDERVSQLDQEMIQKSLQEESQNPTRFNLPSSEGLHRDRSKQQQQQQEYGIVDATPQQPHAIISLSSLKDACPLSRETNNESDDGMSFSSSASSHTEYRVMFSPTSDLFLRTLAMERMFALSMSEWSFRAERNDHTNIVSQFRFLPRRAWNNRLSLLILGLLFLHCSGIVEVVIACLKSASRQFYIVYFRLLFRSETTSPTTPTDHFYNIRNEPMGVWLGSCLTVE